MVTSATTPARTSTPLRRSGKRSASAESPIPHIATARSITKYRYRVLTTRKSRPPRYTDAANTDHNTAPTLRSGACRCLPVSSSLSIRIARDHRPDHHDEGDDRRTCDESEAPDRPLDVHHLALEPARCRLDAHRTVDPAPGPGPGRSGSVREDLSGILPAPERGRGIGFDHPGPSRRGCPWNRGW